MYSVSDEVIEYLNNNNRQTVVMTVTCTDGTVLTITESEIIQGSFTIDRASVSGSKIEIGSAIEAELSFKLRNYDGGYDDITFEGAEIEVKVGVLSDGDAIALLGVSTTEDSGDYSYFVITDGTYYGAAVYKSDASGYTYYVSYGVGYYCADSLPYTSLSDLVSAEYSATYEGSKELTELRTITYIPMGYFIVDDQPRHLSSISISALDRFVLFDCDVDWDKLTFPCTVESLVNQCCDICGITCATTLSDLPNYSYAISEQPTEDTVTYRGLIQWCAGITGTCAFMDYNGEMVFSWYETDTGIVLDKSKRYSSDIYENALAISGVTYTTTETDDDGNEEEVTYLRGSEGYTIDFDDNLLIQDSYEDVLYNIYMKVYSLSYLPYEMSILPAPYLFPMDIITITDKNGDEHQSIVTNVTFTLNSSTSVKGEGETEQTASYSSGSGLTSAESGILNLYKKQYSSAMQAAIASATALITGNQGGYVVLHDSDGDGCPDELLIMDTPDISTTECLWRWNLSGLGYSSSGYDGDYKLAITTTNGAIVADFITTGTLVGGAVTWDLDSGTLIISSADSVTYTDTDGNTSSIASTDQVESAAETATNYLYYSTELGLVITDDTDNVDTSSENSVRVTASEVDVYVSGNALLNLSASGLYVNNATENVAYFTADSSRIGAASSDAWFEVDTDSIDLYWSDTSVFHAGIGDTAETEDITLTLYSFSADDDSGDYSRFALSDGSSYGLATVVTSESTATTYTYYIAYSSSYYCANSLPYSSMAALCTALYSATYEDSNTLASDSFEVTEQSTKPYYTIGTRDLDSIGAYSTTVGYNLIAGQSYQFVVGKYNKEVGSDYRFIVGAGTSSNRKNVFTVDKSGNVTATIFIGDLEGTADYADALTSKSVGGTKQPVYINSSGKPTALSATVGSGVKPIYLSSGTLTVSSSTVGSGKKPIYLSSGELEECSSTVGSSSTPVYLSSGTVTACSSVAAATADALTTKSVGSSSNPVYINSSGVPVACDLDSLAEALDIDVDLSDEYLPLTGGTLSGSLTVAGETISLYGAMTEDADIIYVITDGSSWGEVTYIDPSSDDSYTYLIYFNTMYYGTNSLSYSSLAELISAVTESTLASSTLYAQESSESEFGAQTVVTSNGIQVYSKSYYTSLYYQDDVIHIGKWGKLGSDEDYGYVTLYTGDINADGDVYADDIYIGNTRLYDYVTGIIDGTITG